MINHLVVIFEVIFVQELCHTLNWWSTDFVYGVLKFWMLHLRFTSLFYYGRMDVSEYFIGQVSMWFWTNLKLTNPSVTWTSGEKNGDGYFYLAKKKSLFPAWIDACITISCCVLPTYSDIYRIQSGTMHITNLLAT